MAITDLVNLVSAGASGDGRVELMFARLATLQEKSLHIPASFIV